MDETQTKPGRSRLTDLERASLQKWLSADRIKIVDPTREYFFAEAEKRGLTFGEMLSAILLAVADDEMANAILDG